MSASYEWCSCGYREANIDGYRYILFGANCRSSGLISNHERYVSLDEREAYRRVLLRDIKSVIAVLPRRGNRQ